MKKVSIFISVMLALATIFYSLSIISDNNKCTSVRKFLCSKQNVSVSDLDKIGDITTDTKTGGTQGGNMDTASGSPINDINVINDITPPAELFTAGYDTAYEGAIDDGQYYIVSYSGKDNIKIYFAKDRFWIEKVIRNGITLSRSEINKTFGH